MEKIQTVFFGTGNYAKMIMQGLKYAKLKNKISLKTVVARNLERLSEFKKRFNFDNYSNEQQKELDKPSALKIIVTPAPTHAALIRKSNARLVWAEKPLAMSYEESKWLIEEIKNQNKVVIVDYTYNNDGALKKLAEMVKNGKLGKINAIHAHFLRRDFSETTEEWSPDQSYRRASLDLAPHIIAGFDLMGLEVVEIKNISLIPPEIFVKEPWNDGGEIGIVLKDKFGTSIKGKIDISMARKGGHSNGFEIYSEKGKYFWKYEAKSPRENYGQSFLFYNPAITSDAILTTKKPTEYRLIEKGNDRLELLGKQWDLVLGLAGKNRKEAKKIAGPSMDEKAIKHLKIIEAIEKSTKIDETIKIN